LPDTSLAAEPLPRSILVISEAAVGGPFYPAIFSALQSAATRDGAVFNIQLPTDHSGGE
jgi:hypothetical protein